MTGLPSPIGDVVVCSLEPWDEVWRRNQWLVSELMRLHPDTRFLFVEPPLDLVHSIATRKRPPNRPGLRSIGNSRRLWALQPTKYLPRVVAPGLTERVLDRSVTGAAARLCFTDPLLWVNDSVYASLIERVPWPVVYDVTDDWLLAAISDRTLRRRCREEDLLLKRADQVVAVSAALAESRGKQRSVELIPNGVDVQLFQHPQPRPTDMPEGPVAVYVGTQHADRIDVDLCVEVAQEISPAHLVLVGPNHLPAPSTTRLISAGCVLLGARPFQQVPGYYQHADVVVVPHVITPFTESLDPIKQYEIMAVGRPAVTTAVAELRDLRDPFVVAARTDFAAAVARLLARPRSSAPKQAPTWVDRAEQFAAVLSKARTSCR